MIYSRDNLGNIIEIDELRPLSDRILEPSEWPQWRKTSLTRAQKINGPFVVQTSEGPLKCNDGFLAIDARGYPYPIATEEFHLIYELVSTIDPAPDSQ